MSRQGAVATRRPPRATDEHQCPEQREETADGERHVRVVSKASEEGRRSITLVRIVAERGRLMQQACEQSVGGMAAVIGEERAKVAELCAEFGIEAAIW